jgi:DNA-directed RNA polymerase beta subunit/DNA-directed RNA polymerase beta' subunit
MPDSLLPLTPPEADKPPMELRAFGDAKALRTRLFDSVLQSVQGVKPVANNRYTLNISDAKYSGPDTVSHAQWKQALLSRGSLTRKLVGKVHLVDNATQQPVATRSMTLANVPYVTDHGTFVSSGTEYSLANQLRQDAGVYSRRKANGELESHINVLPGQGWSHRVFMQPDTGVFNMRIGQANLPLMPVLKALGATDGQLREHWGNELYAANALKDNNKTLTKLHDKLIKNAAPGTPHELQAKSVAEAIRAMKINPEVTQHTLGQPFSNVDLPLYLATTKKLIAINRGEADPDDRDSPAFQTLHGPEDLLSERVSKDMQNLRNILWKSTAKGHLDHVSPGIFDKALQKGLLGSGLSQPLEQINPLEVLDQATKVTKLGEGGIQDADAVPIESRNVGVGQHGYIDFLRTPESGSAGVDLRMSSSARKGVDGRMYAPVRDLQTGKTSHMSPQQLIGSTVTFPGELESGEPFISAVRGGRQELVPRHEAQYVIPDGEDAFSSLGNMLPLKSMLAGQRGVMGSRMLAQALPLVDAEAPLVRSASPNHGGKSFEEVLGTHAGAIRSEKPGRVTSVAPDKVVVQHADGTVNSVELHQNLPFNRKTMLHQEPTVQVGQQVAPGQLLAKSNFTDNQGHVALGKNARVAYLPFHGMNYEDAIVVSQSMAERLRSQHAYQHEIEWTDKHKQGLNNFVSMFPRKYSRAQLDNFDDNGVIKPGTKVTTGDPLILAAREGESLYGQIHRGRQAPFVDESLTWEHDNPGEVTDAVHGKKSSNVVVKSTHAMKIGDKLCYSVDTEILTGNGWKPVSEVTVNDTVASLDPAGAIEYLHPAKTMEFEHIGRMYSLETTQVSLCVTDNHKLYVNRHWKSKTRKNRYELLEASDVYGKNFKMKRDGVWRGDSPEYFILPAITVKAGQSGNGTREMPEISIPIKTYAMIMGMFLSEGYTFDSGTNGRGFDIVQVKEPNRAEMLSALDAAGIKYCEHGNGQKIRVYSLQWFTYLDQFGLCWQKFLPPEVFSWAKPELEVLYKWLMWGDGGETGNSPVYFTTSRRLADDVQRLVLHLGMSGNVDSFPARRGTIKGKEYDFRADYHVSIYQKKQRPEINHHHAKNQNGQKETWLDYSGKVHCVQLPRNHVLYVRRNGKPIWCGNSGRYGDKGTVHVVPDDQMPTDKDGLPYEVLSNPLGLISRGNPAQIAEAALGRVAAKTGQPYSIKDWEHGADHLGFAQRELAKHGMNLKEDVLDPETGRKIGNVYVGNRWFMKLHHESESKGQGRGIGSYTSEGQPARGGVEGAKRVGMLHLGSLLSHGATHVIADIKLSKGQANPERWSQIASGYTPSEPDVPYVYKKFIAHLQGSGINPVRQGTQTHLMALTDKDIDKLAEDRELQNTDTVDWTKGQKPIRGGLFDESLFGSKDDEQRWGKITLHEPMPNPVMEEPIRKTLGLTEKKFRDILAGREQLNGQTGPAAVKQALASINLPKAIEQARHDISGTKKGVRDAAIKRLGYLKSAERIGVHPQDWMLSKMPVLPPSFRPVTTLGATKMPLVADANYLYHELFHANKNLKELSAQTNDTGDERLAVYDTMKGLTGLGDPTHVKNQERGVKGLLKQVFGCYDEETELLTRAGWFRFADLPRGEPVATLNQATGMFEWQVPTEYQKYRYCGEMVRLQYGRHNKGKGRNGTRVDLLITPNHRNWVRKRLNKHGYNPSNGWEFEEAWRTAASTNRAFVRTAAAGWSGHSRKPAFVEGCLTDFAEFVGWWSAEGWIHSDGKIVNICQETARNAKKTARINELLVSIGLPFTRHDYKKTNENGVTTKFALWSVMSTELVAWLREHVGEYCDKKSLSSEVRDWCTEALAGVLNGYMGGDGGARTEAAVTGPDKKTHKYRSHLTDTHNKVHTTSRKLFDDLVEIGCKLGLTLRYGEPQNGQGNQKVLYVGIMGGQQFTQSEGKDGKSFQHYDGYVYCCTVPNGVLFVRRNGIPVFSGNSTAKLGVVQRKLLGTPTDMVGRATIMPNPDLDMDSVGLPEKHAWSVYKPFVIGNLVRSGMPRLAAAQAVEKQTPQARQALLQELDKRPVIVDRAPALHRFSMMAARPRLVKGDALQVNPTTIGSFGGDFDGNCSVFGTLICLEIDFGLLYKSSRIYFNSLEECLMRVTGSTKLPVSGAMQILLPIGELPTIGNPAASKTHPNQRVYELPAGLSVLSYNPETGGAIYSPITHLTREDNHACVLVETARNRKVEVSDNESLCVYDTDVAAVRKSRPDQSVGKFSPFVKQEPISGNEFDYEIGWWYGAVVADGWKTPRTIGYSKLDDAKRLAFERIARNKINPNFSMYEYVEEKTDAKLSNSKKIHLNGKQLCESVFNFLAERCDDDNGLRSALFKKIPEEILSRGSRNCLLGVLAGLLEGDRSIGWNTVKAKKQFVANLCTSSPHLVASAGSLFRKLGLRYSVTTTPPKGMSHESYTICISIVDLHKLVPELSFVAQDATQLFQEFLGQPPASDDRDVIPVPIALADKLSKPLLKDHKPLYLALRATISKKRPLSRDTCKRVLTAIDSLSLDHPQLRQWRTIVDDHAIHWDEIKTVTPTHTQTVYDIVVPETKVYAIGNGLIIWDTMNYSVPTSDEAAEEAYAKMLPSRNLFSIARLHAAQYVPTQEYLGGLHTGSTDRSEKHPIVFDSVKSMRAAYYRGEISPGQSVDIRE